jgi:Domain of unknown function (DUF4145)
MDGQCGWCGKAVAFERHGTPVRFWSGSGPPPHRHYSRVAATFICPRAQCLHPTLFLFTFADGIYGAILEGKPSQIPRGQPTPMEGLPEQIQADRREAYSCLYGGDYRAAVIMGRAAIQRAVRQLDAEGAGLKAEIINLEQRRVITTTLREWADEVRIAGDEAAHPENLGEITAGEAEESLRFMDAFLDHSIALPAARDARKQARQQPHDHAGEG